MDRLIQEELERMKLLSNYDNSRTLSEQLKNNPADKFNVLPKVTTPLSPNQQAAMNAGYGPVAVDKADELAAQGKLNALSPVKSPEPKSTGKPEVKGKPMVTKPANPADKFNVLPSGKTNPSGKPTKPSGKPTSGGRPTSNGQPMVIKPANPADKFNVLPTGKSTTGGQPMVYKQPTAADKFNEKQQSLGQAPSAVNPSNLTKQGQGKPVANKPSGVSKPATPAPIQLKNVNGVKSFQDWLDTNVKGWAKGYKDGMINKGQNGGGYGKFGPRTQKAWSQYKDQYLKMEPITPKGVKELPVQTQGSERVEPKPVTSQKPPTQDQEITLQGNPKSAFG